MNVSIASWMPLLRHAVSSINLAATEIFNSADANRGKQELASSLKLIRNVVHTKIRLPQSSASIRAPQHLQL